MFWDIARNAARNLPDRVATPEPGTINRFDPAGRTVRYNRLRENTGDFFPLLVNPEAANGATGHAFFDIDGWPVDSSKGGSATFSAGPRNALWNSARINLHTGYPCTVANFHSSTTTGVSLTADLQGLTWTAASIPDGAGITHACSNAKYAQGESNSYANTNDIPSGWVENILQYVMVAWDGDPPCLTDFGDGTLNEDTSVPDLSDGTLLLAKHGQKCIVRWQSPYDPDEHLCKPWNYEDGSPDYNESIQPRSHVAIAADTTSAGTVGAYYANLSGTPTNPQTYKITSDDDVAYRVNNHFEGGNHGIYMWPVTITGHGFGNAVIGETGTISGRDYLVARKLDANRLGILAPISGSYTNWSLDTTSPGTGTISITQSGGSPVNKTIASVPGSFDQLYPCLQAVERRILLDGGRFADANGVYLCRKVHFITKYRVANTKRMYEALAAHAGDSDPFVYDDPDIGSAFSVTYRASVGAYGTETSNYELAVLEAHTRTSMWPAQHQKTTAITGSGETLHYLVPNSLPLQSGTLHNGGVTTDFTAWVNVTSNAVEWYWDEARRADAAVPVRCAAYDVRTSGGATRHRFVMANSALKGRTATDDYCDNTLFLSGGTKTYMWSDGPRSVTTADVDSHLTSSGFMDLTLDPVAEIYHAFDIGGGEMEVIWYSLDSSLSGHVMPLRADLAGKRFEVVAGATSFATVAIVGDQVTITANGGKPYVTLRAY